MEKIVVKNLVENGKHFCVLPWVHFHAWPDKRVMPCCVADSDLPTSEIRNDESIIQPLLVEINRPNLKSMQKIRTIIYRYLLLNFSPTLLFSLIRAHYIKILPEKKKYQLINISSKADQYMNSISYNIFALEFLILNIKHLLL